MDCILLKAGGGGVGSDELTASAANVLAGTTYVGSDTNDEAGTGTMVDKSGSSQSATATLDSTNKRVQLTVPATGKYDTKAKLYVDYATLASLLGVEAAKMLTTETILGVQGTIGSKAAATYYATTSDQTISAGQYLSGAQTIKKLTATNLTAANILKGKTITINNGNANVWSVAGSLAVTSAISFSAAARSASVIRISWTNPSKGPWEGVEIRMSTSGSPGVSGGTQKYKGKGNNATAGGSNYVDITGLSFATTYYFTCTSYATGLGNGSSYNVSAKTSELVLWNGSAVQNGAFLDENVSVKYEHSAGALVGRKLVCKLKSTITKDSTIDVAETRDSPYAGATCSYSTSGVGYSSIYDAMSKPWNANQEYVFDLSSYLKSSVLSVAHRFRVTFFYETYSDYEPYNITEFSYIALR